MGIRRARNRAKLLLAEHPEMSIPPVDVRSLATNVGVTVVEREGLHHPDHGDVSGLLVRRSGVAVCVVNADHHENRRRFSIAHELGHFLLHPPVESYVDSKFTVAARGESASAGVDLMEIEANAFAAELLMPEAWIRASVTGSLDLFDDEKISKLARECRVSNQAMTYRLINLGLLPS